MPNQIDPTARDLSSPLNAASIAPRSGPTLPPRQQKTDRPQQKIGTAADSKWLQYAAQARPQRATNQPWTLPDLLIASIDKTCFLRLLLAAFYGILMAVAADSAIMEKHTFSDGSSALFTWQQAFIALMHLHFDKVWWLFQEALSQTVLIAIIRLGPSENEKLVFPPVPFLALLSLAVILITAIFLRMLATKSTGTQKQPFAAVDMFLKLIPGLTEKLARLAAWQRVFAAVLDDIAVYIVSMALYSLLPDLL